MLWKKTNGFHHDNLDARVPIQCFEFRAVFFVRHQPQMHEQQYAVVRTRIASIVQKRVEEAKKQLM